MHGEPDKKKDTHLVTRAVVDLIALSHNLSEIKRIIGAKTKIMAVVKADGYGHGALNIARTALLCGADSLAVALPEEGISLRKAGITCPILVLGATLPESAYKIVDAGLEQTLCTTALAEALNALAGKMGVKVQVHIKFDTGMGRIGVMPRDACSFITKISTLKHLSVKGVITHLSSADEPDRTHTLKQLKRFDKIVKDIRTVGVNNPLIHAANSAGIIAYPEAHYDLVRSGIMMYGGYPNQEMKAKVFLNPVMTFMTKVAHVKRVPAGNPIGYGRVFHSQQETIVATLPVGYADGYSRLLSGLGTVLVKGEKASIIGRVCMDMSMIDVTNIKDVCVGDDVILFGEAPTAADVAGIMGTIDYEVLTSIGKRVPRIYVHDNN